MSILIKRVNDKVIEYDRGAFDEWCVYLTEDNIRRAPFDPEYFHFFQDLAFLYGDKPYQDFVTIYDMTTKEIDDKVLNKITEIASTYDDSEYVDIWLTVMYAGMVAEENKENTKLGKRVKRLGMYQVLNEGMSGYRAASFSKGKRWMVLDRLMTERGF